MSHYSISMSTQLPTSPTEEQVPARLDVETKQYLRRMSRHFYHHLLEKRLASGQSFLPSHSSARRRRK